MSKPLVIVESPTKVKTISKILGSDYVVKSSVGHIRDLPRNAKSIPSNYTNKTFYGEPLNQVILRTSMLSLKIEKK